MKRMSLSVSPYDPISHEGPIEILQQKPLGCQLNMLLYPDATTGVRIRAVSQFSSIMPVAC